MKALAGIVFIALFALLIIGAVVFLGNDTAILTPPPEAVVENFVRSLTNERFDPARRSLSDKLRATTNTGSLRRLGDCLRERFGQIDDVEGAPGRKDLCTAEALAELKLAGGRRARLRFPLLRERGTWRIADLQVESVAAE